VTIITLSDGGMDTPESHCSECEMFFNLSWNRNPIYQEPQCCPFCGEEIDEIIDERD
jgi:hypothetical protein